MVLVVGQWFEISERYFYSIKNFNICRLYFLKNMFSDLKNIYDDCFWAALEYQVGKVQCWFVVLHDFWTVDFDLS
jgi:hypothetical protein